MKRKIVDKKQKSPKQKVDYAILFRHLKKHKGKIALYMFLMAFSVVTMLCSLSAIAEVVNAATIPDLNKVAIYLIAYSALFIIERCIYIVAFQIFRKITQDVTVDIRNELSNRIFSISSKSYNQVSTGEFISRITNSPRTIISCVWDAIDTIFTILGGLAVIVYIFVLNYVIAIILALFLVALFLIERIRIKAISKRRKESKKAGDSVNSFVNEVVRSEKDVKALNLEQSFKKQSNDIYLHDAKLFRKTNTFAFNSWVSVLIFAEIIILGVLLLSIYFTYHDIMALSVLIFLIMNIDRVKGIGISLGNMSDSISEIGTEVGRLNEVFDESKYALEKFGNEDFDNEFEGNIELKNVSFSYDGEKNIIDGMSLKIPKGKTVAFVGKSGSGKTTLVSLISKLYEVTGGELYLDNKNINDLSKDALRKNIALINQFPYIFDSSIRKNLSISNENATEEDMWEVLEKANLKEFVQELPDKLETVVGENGVKLSGGQKQRLAIARAFLKESKILIFDESTSSLDNFAQAHVQKSIEEMKGQKTIVIVAHRLSTIRNADIIYMVENGKILNHGNFEYLFENEQKFKNMFIAENIENE